MRADRDDLTQALDHAPAIAWIDADRTDHAAHAASACVAGGFRTLAVSARVPEAAAVIDSLAARPDTVIGLAMPGSAADCDAAARAGAAFVVCADIDREVATACAAAGVSWIPGAATAGEMRAARDAGADLVHLFPAATSGGPRHLRLLRAAYPDLRVIAGGGVGGDQLDAWFDAGARAVLLAGALYSPALLASGDRMMIRNHAAAAHREATRFARTGTTTAATTGRDV